MQNNGKKAASAAPVKETPQAQPDGKLPYSSPKLTRFGTLRDMTKTGSGPALDTTPNNSSAPHHSSQAA